MASIARQVLPLQSKLRSNAGKERKGTDLFPRRLLLFLGRGRPSRRPVEYPRAGEVFDFEDEGLRARQLITLHSHAKELELKFRNATRDKLAIPLLPLLDGGRKGK